jgi:arabinose-5-phosphate isomerase
MEATAIHAAAVSVGVAQSRAVSHLLSILESGGKIAVTGVGKNHAIAQKISATFNSLNVPSYHFDSYHALHGDLGAISKSDAVIYLSRSGNTAELVEVASQVLAQKGNYQLAIVCNKNSKLSMLMHDNWVLPFEGEADRFDLAPSCSSTLLLSVGDALGIVLSERRGFRKEDFLRNHPGGSLGARLKEELMK